MVEAPPSTVAAIDGPSGPVDEAFSPMSVTVRLADDLDISRGDMLARPANRPMTTQDVDAMVCWMDAATTLAPGQKLSLLHTTRSVRAQVTQVDVRSGQDVEVHLDHGVRVDWGSADQSAEKAQVLAVLLKQHARVYDVSAPDLPTTRH